jgi:hypothetical protein
MQRYLVDPVNGLPTNKTHNGTGVEEDQRIQYIVTEPHQFLSGNIGINHVGQQLTEAYALNSTYVQLPPAYYAPPPAPAQAYVLAPAPTSTLVHSAQAWTSAPAQTQFTWTPAQTQTPTPTSTLVYPTPYQVYAPDPAYAQAPAPTLVYPAHAIVTFNTGELNTLPKEPARVYYPKYPDPSTKGGKLVYDTLVDRHNRELSALKEETNDLKVVLKKQFELTKRAETEVRDTKNELEDLRQERFREAANKVREAQARAEQATQQRAQVEGLRKQLAEAQAERARAEAARADAAAKDLAAERERAAKAQAAAEDRAVIEVDRLQQQLKNAVKDKEQTSLELIQSEHRWQQWLESDKREQNQRAQVIPSERLETAEGRAAETETLRLQQERDAARAAQAAAERERDAAKEEIAILKGSISSFRDSLENIKTQFEKLKNLFGSEDIKTKPKPNIEYKQGDRQNNFKLKWILNLDELKKKTTGYNIFLKFTVFSDDQQSEEEQQKALSQVALLKLKLIELGKNNDSAQFLNHNETINGYLNKVSRLMAVSNFNLDDEEIKEFCEEYFLLGQQYRKILDKEKEKSDSNIKKMMSCKLRKEIICYNNQSAIEYSLGDEDNFFENQLTIVSTYNFNSIIDAHSDSSDKTNDVAKKNDDKIILLTTFILSLEQACKGHEEIEKDSPDQIKILPEVAKVFVTLDEDRAPSFWDKLTHEKQIQLKEFLEKELQYSRVEQEAVVGRTEMAINESVEISEKNKTIWGPIKRLQTHKEKQVLKSRLDPPTKEVSDFFKKRELRCRQLLDYNVKDKPEVLSLSGQEGEGVNSAVEKKSDEFSNFLDSLNSVIRKFNEDFREILRGGEDEVLPDTVLGAGAGVRAPNAEVLARAEAAAPPPDHSAGAAGRGGGSEAAEAATARWQRRGVCRWRGCGS